MHPVPVAPPTTSANDRAAPAAPWFRFQPEDGVLTLLLVALVVYLTVFSIESVSPPWAPGLAILTTTTGAGLVMAYLAIQQGRLPGALVHGVALLAGVLLAFQQTAQAVAGGNRLELAHRTAVWLQRVLVANGSSSDNDVFLLFLAVLTYWLAYISVWLVVRTRRPWLTVIANGVVLLINLGASDTSQYFFLLLYLLAALLLLVRFTLAENMRRWRARHLRFSPDLGWDFMQTGTIFAVVVLLIAYLLPVGTADGAILAAINAPASPWTQFQQRFEQVFGGLSGSQGPGGMGFFGNSLRLVGSVNLTNVQIMHFSASGADPDPSQYLMTQTFDTYNGSDLWTQSFGQYVDYSSNQTEPAPSAFTQQDTYGITLDNAPPGGQRNLFGPGSLPASFSVPAAVLVTASNGVATTWQAQHALPEGESYRATGYVSTATVSQLQSVPYATQVASSAQASQYPTALLDEYLPDSSAYISLYIRKLALSWTAGATNMYDAAVMIEDHLRTFTYSTHNPDPPAGEDATVWFLQRQVGFCTFFASAMALMGRALGMPTRLVSGFSTASFDSHLNAYVVRGTSAHTWPQIYFGKYGWINFEPTSSFSKFARALPSGAALPPGLAGTQTPGTRTTPAPKRAGRNTPQSGGLGPRQSSSPLATAGLVLALLLLALLLVAALVVMWWRLRFRQLSPVAGAFARIVHLGAWAGAPPRRDQTPHEYAEQLAALVPWQRVSLEELSDLYARERWGGTQVEVSTERLPRTYDSVRRSITPLIVRRLRFAPAVLLWRLRQRVHRHR